MKIYKSMSEKLKRTFTVGTDYVELQIETIQNGKWISQSPIKYTPELVKGWGFSTFDEFIAWKILERGMEEATP